MGLRTLDRPQQQQEGTALRWATEEMRGDREIVMAAVQRFRKGGDSDPDIERWLVLIGVPADVVNSALTR